MMENPSVDEAQLAQAYRLVDLCELAVPHFVAPVRDFPCTTYTAADHMTLGSMTLTSA